MARHDFDLLTQPLCPLPSDGPGWAWPYVTEPGQYSALRNPVALPGPRGRRRPRRTRVPRYREEAHAERGGFESGWPFVAASSVGSGSGSGESGSGLSSRPVGSVKRERM